MAKTKQSSVVFSPDEMAEFGRQQENEKGLTLFELETRVKNLENSMRTMLEQITDLSIQMDTLQHKTPKADKAPLPEPNATQKKKEKPPEPSPQLLQAWRDKIYTFLNESGDKHTTIEIKQALGFDEHRDTFQAAMKLLKEEKRVDGELDEKTSHKSWWAIP